MSIQYDSRRETLAQVIASATHNATYVIPDLQRSYVWKPSQVIMLIDSLFKGWPFGSLLLWEVQPNCFDKDGGIPHRPFWQIVDRTGQNKGSTNSPIGQPATYQMVLDGQQRVQSLILALGGDQWGLKLLDSEWASDLQDREIRTSAYWSKASLCVDLELFAAELKAKNNVVRKMEVGKILAWAILDVTDGQSTERRPGTYDHPLKTSEANPGRFIRLSRFWDLVQNGLDEDEYKEKLDPILKNHKVDSIKIEGLIGSLSKFMQRVEAIKRSSHVHALQIQSFQVTPQWSRDDYSDAIVNIFTRLNTAGRTLTREEITMAWLKVGWQENCTNHKTAGKCLEDLNEKLAANNFSFVKMDDIVRLISFVWAVEKNTGKLLDSKDLLKGEIIRPMANDISTEWGILEKRIESCITLIEERGLVNKQYSFNAIVVYFTWYRLVFDQFEKVACKATVIAKDSIEKELLEKSKQFLDRWIFGSQWSGVWSDGSVGNFQTFAMTLNFIFCEIGKSNSVDFIDSVKASIEKMMGLVAEKAIAQVKIVSVSQRNRVSTYYSYLWVWHRITAPGDDSRWENSSIQMRTGGKRVGKLEVDHTVAHAFWEQLIETQVKEKLATFTGTEQEKELLAPGRFNSKEDAKAFINLLGNCSLLDKSFNISKSDKPMYAFLKEVHEFINNPSKLKDWEEALFMTSVMTQPDKYNFLDIVKDIQERDNRIRNDLVEFIQGKKFLTDKRT